MNQQEILNCLQMLKPCTTGDTRLAIEELENLVQTRAGKLLINQKNFIVIREDEPYFEAIYNLIKAYETVKGTWTEQDERDFYKICRPIPIRLVHTEEPTVVGFLAKFVGDIESLKETRQKLEALRKRLCIKNG